VDWSHFGLDRQPFRPAVDTDSYYPSSSHQKALDTIASGFARREPAVLLDGLPGIGKTLIARKWLEHLLPEVPRVVLPSVLAEKPAELLQAILFDLAKPYEKLSEQELRLALTGHLLDVANESGYPTVLLLDEAQHLSQPALEELRLLGNLETRRGNAVFALLVAHPMLRETLRHPACELFSQRLAVCARIEPLSPTESAEYLRHQIRAAGGEASTVFDDAALSLISAACNGIPRMLNRVATQALELCAEAGATQVDVEAALEALERVGLKVQEANDAAEVNDITEALKSPAADSSLLVHPSPPAEPTESVRGKRAEHAASGEATGARGPKDKATRKRTA
jgi:type II secretory pathway predicted ATPase ExeA